MIQHALPEIVSTLIAAAIFAFILYRGGTIRGLLKSYDRTLASAAGGAAVAYVFIHLSPEVNAAAREFRTATKEFWPLFLRYGVNLAVMFGFLFFYTMEELVLRSKDPAKAAGPDPLFRLHMIVFAAYAWTVSFLLVHSHEVTVVQQTFYTVAMGLHFLSLGNGLRETHGARYDLYGGKILGAACLVGWGSGILFTTPGIVLNLLLGIVAGGVIANTIMSELPRDKDGQIWPFIAGAIVYAFLLIRAG